MKHIALLTIPRPAQSDNPELNAAYMQLIMLVVTEVLPLIQTIMSLKGATEESA